MQRRPGSGGREKRVGSGGGNANRRGSGIGGGPVGNPGSYEGRGSSGGSGGSSRSSGGNGGLIAALLMLLLGSGGNKKGGFRRILLIIVLVIVAYFLFKQCSANENQLAYQQDYSNTTIESAFGNNDHDTPESPDAAQAAASSPEASHDPDYSVSNKAREKYTVIKGGGEDKITLMVYMCGTDLESEYGMATSDLNEMLHGDIGDKINIIVETGGTKKWKNSVISSSTNQIYQVRDNGLLCLEKDIGKKAMTNAETLSDFIRYCAKSFPADRYGLILWDHGGGSLSGYGYDQKFTGTSLTLDKLDKALTNGGIKFDFIGFDACLMANYETAVVSERHADYLIASEETEPGSGWYYTDWLSKLSNNTSMPTVQIGKNIIDDFISASAKQAPGSATTLSIIDLAEMSGTVPEKFNVFAKDTASLLDSDQFKTVSNARDDAREFAQSSHINQIDLIDMCGKLDTDASSELASALKACIKYNKHSSDMNRSNGVSIYFPYGRLSSVNEALSIYESIDMDKSYTECIRSFASLTAGGQIASGSDSSPLTTLLGSDSGYSELLGSLLGSSQNQTSSLSGSDILTGVLESYLGGGSSSSSMAQSIGSLIGGNSNSSSGYGDGYGSILEAMLGGSANWLDSDRMLRSASYYDGNRIDAEELIPTVKGDSTVLKLSDAQWELVQNLELNVFLDDGEGYIDLGMDNTYSWDEDGDLIMDYDRTWLSLNGQVVSYYMIDENRDDSAGKYVINGRVPAMLNGRRVDIMLQFSDEIPEGRVLGANIIYDPGETDTLAKGLVEIQKGDKIDFLCDYYNYDGSYSDSYMLGERMSFSGKWNINNLNVGEGKCKISYCLSDIYNNRYWTQTLDY